MEKWRFFKNYVVSVKAKFPPSPKDILCASFTWGSPPVFTVLSFLSRPERTDSSSLSGTFRIYFVSNNLQQALTPTRQDDSESALTSTVHVPPVGPPILTLVATCSSTSSSPQKWVSQCSSPLVKSTRRIRPKKWQNQALLRETHHRK